MATSEPSTAVGFFDLPPEIRNMVYHLALPEEKLVGLPRYKFYDPLERPKGAAKPFLSLRRVNRQFRDEITPMLYDHLAFEFYDARNFKRWINYPWGLKQHVKNITFDIYALAQIRSVLHEFKTTAISLQTITFVMHTWNHEAIRPFTVYAAAFVPFLRAVRKADKTGLSNQALVDLIAIQPLRQSGSYTPLPKFDEEAEKTFRKYEADVKAEMIRLLG
ncbi:hypothetical protein BDY17DRAFT_325378 [Neohortaea acidophila]|uniref:F-box domain-containing protein n=1 Tax=Neohortaea acidophila TaxID=245834 RepID=A0A6A6PRM3_9PEZI|nr:uncharacterized protein BDY17DRAFT_325378 [Neohortaea acidophila]KAF2481867.1 hypothetical protein BDY17DRAFT_325378 [Neohortaea acidophila]